MSAYFITGDPGAGKTSVIEELARHGYAAYNTDDMASITRFYSIATGQPVTHHIAAPIDFSQYDWRWDIPALKKLIATSSDPTFVAAITSNSDDNFHLFKTVFALKPSAEILKQRLLTRTNNNFGKHPDELTGILKYHSISGDHWSSKGAIIIDADQPIAKVADDILSHIAQ